MEERGYTWFGEVLYRILKERGASQSALAREARERGLDYRQNSVSNWMRGVHAAPRELPTLMEELYDLSAQEWIELGLAFAYGQRVRRRDLGDLHDFRTRYKYFFIEQEGLSFAAKTIED
jgi:transcriptional regulator with XRE-family HTH domain